MRDSVVPRTPAAAIHVPLCVVVLALSGCGDPETETAPPSEAPPNANSQQPVEDSSIEDAQRAEIKRLAELGYAEFAEEVADSSEEFVTMEDPGRVAPGYNLIDSAGKILLFDQQAELLHTWHTPGVNWVAPVLLPNGDVLVSGAAQKGEYERAGLCVARLAWDSEPVWFRWHRSHHDVAISDDGTVAALTAMTGRIIPEIHPDYKVRDEGISLLNLRNGQKLKEVSLYDMMAASPDVVEVQLHPRAQTAMEREGIDLLHSNAVDFMRFEHLVERSPIYTIGYIVVTIRHQDVVLIVDMDAERVVWAWGQGEIAGPHDGQILPSGNILLFDNGPERGWSRAVEVDPLTNEIVWEYRAPVPEDFFTIGRGSVQRLDNGNTLLADSDSGEAIEVTHEGEIVWHFRNFDTDKEGRRATFAFVRRHPVEPLDELLAGDSGK